MATKHRGRPEEVHALDAYIKLARAANTVGALTARRLGEHGLTESQFGVLEALFHLGPMCQRELGTKILKSSGNVTLVVDNLEKRGLARRERGQEDRRFVSVRLTEEGRALIEGIFPGHAAAIAEALGVLDPGEQAELSRLCKKLGLALAAREE
ncbi:MarR family transcriptional regulator [Myxococcota bacterium]|nr:MarR family transcriptional regulator [Myxococcota bacterium]